MDSKGAMGFPMRLSLAFILLALCIPSLSQMVTGFEEQSETELAGTQADRIIQTSSELYYSGTGSGRTLHISVPAGYCIIVGGDEQYHYSVRIARGDEIVSATYTEHPSIYFLGEGITISGECDIGVSCISRSGVYGIEVNRI